MVGVGGGIGGVWGGGRDLKGNKMSQTDLFTLNITIIS